MVKKTSFEYLDEARLDAGFFVADACEWLGVSRSTWFRWKKCGLCPRWALKSMELRAGNLEILGWKYWRLDKDVLYRTDFIQNIIVGTSQI
jgi:hypothetical protein